MKLNIKKLICIYATAPIIMLAGGCSQDSLFTFSFDNSIPSDCVDQRSFNFNSTETTDTSPIKLDINVKMDLGEIVLKVVDTEGNGEVVWTNKYTPRSHSNSQIDLTDLKSDNEYTLKVIAKQTQKVDVKVKSNSKSINIQPKLTKPLNITNSSKEIMNK